MNLQVDRDTGADLNLQEGSAVNLQEGSDVNLQAPPHWRDPAYDAWKHRERYAARKAQGLCPRCGKRPPSSERNPRCVRCTMKQNLTRTLWGESQKKKASARARA
jgi:hypothetical protein